ncbi:hypothetical protein [uncultured Eubacterium sp.]|uniref:hypothetical protein n=1 Tax=uncultured Eubacterium sp. TaxID=165185 RepID=UPI0025990AEC|nr:hypothetical protein [uncultured Eubacterium sp.]
MEYDVENEAERRQALQRFYEEYDAVRRKYGLMMSMHASVYDCCWIRIWQGSGVKKKMVIKVENDSETLCYHVATEALISWVENKEACQNGREEINHV